MSNPLFQAMRGNSPTLPGPLGNFAKMMQQFNQFRATFQGDPKAEVERLIQSGQMSQQQLNQLQSAAQQFMQLMPK